jgi:hypothetical protein
MIPCRVCNFYPLGSVLPNEIVVKSKPGIAQSVDGEVQVEWPGISTHLSPAMRRAAASRPTQWMVKYRMARYIYTPESSNEEGSS